MNIYYLDDLGEIVFLPYQSNVKTRHDVAPKDFGEYVPSPEEKGRLVHRSLLMASPYDPVIPMLAMMLLGSIIGWGLQKYITLPFDGTIWVAVMFGILTITHFLYTLYRSVKFNRTP